MKIDLIITELDVGGAEQTLSRLAIGLQQLGDDVRVFSIGRLPQSDGGGKDRIVSELKAYGLPITSGNATNVSSLPRVAWELRSWLAKRPEGIRQSFLFHANVLVNSVDPMATSAGHRFAGIRVAESRRVRLRIERLALRRARQVVCVSAAVEQFAHRSLKISPDRTTVIPNSVDVDHFATAEPIDWQTLGWPGDAKVVLFVGRLHPQKNLKLLQSFLDSFAPQGGPVRLLMIGEGPQRDSLQKWTDDVPGDRVRLLPWQAAVGRYLAACRVLVLPSLYEGMPNVVMEAMAAGKPVVCSNVEGSAELLGNDSLQVFDLSDAKSMADRLNHFLADDQSAHQTGRQNQKRMRDSFSVQSMVNAYRKTYQNVC